MYELQTLCCNETAHLELAVMELTPVRNMAEAATTQHSQCQNLKTTMARGLQPILKMYTMSPVTMAIRKKRCNALGCETNEVQLGCIQDFRLAFLYRFTERTLRAGVLGVNGNLEKHAWRSGGLGICKRVQNSGVLTAGSA